MLINERPIAFLYRLNDFAHAQDVLEDKVLPKYLEYGLDFSAKI